MQVNIHEAKTHFEKLVKRVVEEEVIITENNKPLVKLNAIEQKRNQRKIGTAKGQI